jgi:hypothetical protein
MSNQYFCEKYEKVESNINKYDWNIFGKLFLYNKINKNVIFCLIYYINYYVYVYLKNKILIKKKTKIIEFIVWFSKWLAQLNKSLSKIIFEIKMLLVYNYNYVDKWIDFFLLLCVSIFQY